MAAGVFTVQRSERISNAFAICNIRRDSSRNIPLAGGLYLRIAAANANGLCWLQAETTRGHTPALAHALTHARSH